MIAWFFFIAFLFKFFYKYFLWWFYWNWVFFLGCVDRAACILWWLCSFSVPIQTYASCGRMADWVGLKGVGKDSIEDSHQQMLLCSMRSCKGLSACHMRCWNVHVCVPSFRNSQCRLWRHYPKALSLHRECHETRALSFIHEMLHFNASRWLLGSHLTEACGATWKLMWLVLIGFFLSRSPHLNNISVGYRFSKRS